MFNDALRMKSRLQIGATSRKQRAANFLGATRHTEIWIRIGSRRLQAQPTLKPDGVILLKSNKSEKSCRVTMPCRPYRVCIRQRSGPVSAEAGVRPLHTTRGQEDA
jgi:hypothetical protein